MYFDVDRCLKFKMFPRGDWVGSGEERTHPAGHNKHVAVLSVSLSM